jgi:predicted dehydrogenase
VKFLIAGFGSIGRRHLRNLLALGERDILLYRSYRSTLPAEEIGQFPIETDLQAALDHRPDAVIISNPTALHLDIAIPAARQGCHILLEKPVSHSLEQLDQLRSALQSRGGQLLVGFQFRFHPGLQKVASLLSENTIGRPLSARAVYAEYLPGMHPWEDYRQGYSARDDLGGGVILTLCHPLDTLCWLLGEVDSLWAFHGRLNDLEIRVEDTAEIGLRFSSGALGSAHLDYNRRPPAHTLEIIGAQGLIYWDNADGAVTLYQADSHLPPRPPSLKGRGKAIPGVMKEINFPAPPGFHRNDMFLSEMRHFLAVCRGEATPLCTLDDGIQALRLALAAHESAQTGQLVKLKG